LSLRQKYLDVVSRLVTPGAVGVAVLLGSAVPSAASQDALTTVRSGEGVSERLAAIREAVSAVASETGEASGAAGGRKLAWGNWRNGGGFGFGFGSPWGNFGFGGGPPWHNWNNWRNGWHNWGNGWGNW
jgi:hypothetical protein